jgi:hypothetical protein
MSTYTRSFSEITTEQLEVVGGKGGSLAQLYQAGYPVPPGFVILPSAFEGESITSQAWREVQQQLLTCVRLPRTFLLLSDLLP